MRSTALLIAFVVMGSSIANADAPTVVSRKDWGAAPANVQMMRKHVLNAIIVHHTGERARQRLPLEMKLKNLQSFSMRSGHISETGKRKPAWGDVPYHFYIDSAGRIGEGRAVEFAGDTNTGYDTDGYIQIVLEGHFDHEKPTLSQLSALNTLVIWLAKTYEIASENITGHDEHASTDCPGKHLKLHLDALRKKVKH